MKKKQLKFKIYQHECVDCGWKIWRDYEIKDPICSNCESTNPPNITEDELIREIIINDTYETEDYEKAKRIAQEIADGKPLEEIEGLDLGDDLDISSEPMMLSRELGSGISGDLRVCVLKGFVSIQSVPIMNLPHELKNRYY